MAVEYLKYCEYFDVNEKYFPCIDESAINDGAPWNTTYPHETFIKLLELTEKVLGGNVNRSIWIHGSYGTGKSQCAHTLRKLLEVSEDEVKAYWDKFEPLKKRPVLLQKLLGHKKQGIVSAYRYSSGDIHTPQKLFLSIQESINKALEEQGIAYKGQNTLKESVIAWLEDESHKRFMDDLLKKPKWASAFSQSTADEIINTLRKLRDASSLMDNILSLAEQEGITALDLTADSLRKWIIDIIEKNNIKIVLVWDEFSDYFRQNSTSLGEFQKIVSICQEKPFYFIIVTHPLSSLAKDYDSSDRANPWTVVQQRFEKVEITLPDNIAFELIGHAFSIKPAAKEAWEKMVEELTAYVPNARKAVIKAANISNENAMKSILPIHPMAALVLKNIAVTFQSNQRSIFDFIKTSEDMDVKAFQWFIQNAGPTSERKLLTVDMLWNFFYEKGKDNLAHDIRLILDTYPQQEQLNESEKTVLKTVLIMQSMDQRLGGMIPLLKPTDQNISYAFEGDSGELETSCKSIAKALVDKGILIENLLADGQKVFSTAKLAGDSGRIEEIKKKIREIGTTDKLVQTGPAVAEALNLTPALKLRYARDPFDSDHSDLLVVTKANFKKIMDQLKGKDANWRFYAVLALAKTEEEAQSFRTLIRETIADPDYKNIIVIDALSTPLGREAFEQFVDHEAMAEYYKGNNKQQSEMNHRKAKNVLEGGWKNKINEGQFLVFSYAEQFGERAIGAEAVRTILQTLVLNRFPHVQDFAKGLTEAQFKLTNPKNAAKFGTGAPGVSGGVVKDCDKKVLAKFWDKKEYWKIAELADEHIVIIKNDIEEMIAEAFKSNGKIAIGDIYDNLAADHGFPPCNLSAFLTGFLLKEYSKEPCRCMDAEGHSDAMTPDKLSEMIGNYIGKKPKNAYIMNLTDKERAFYNLTKSAWSITRNASSPQQAGTFVHEKMRELKYPVWCLEEVDTTGAFELVKLYIKLVKDKGDDAHDVANEIGTIVMQRPSVTQNLKELLSSENCKKGIQLFIEGFEGGKLYNIAKDINADDRVLADIKRVFSVEYSALWDRTTGEDEIRKLITEYEVVKSTNAFLNGSAKTKETAFKAWREEVKFMRFSSEAVRAKRPMLQKFFDHLLGIAKNEEVLPERLKAFLAEMTEHETEIRAILQKPLAVFKEIYAPYLEGFSDVECEDIKNSITIDMFTATETVCNAAVKKAAEDYKKSQKRNQLQKLWEEKVGSLETPRAWSDHYLTPILCCVKKEQYTEAKKAFATLNGDSGQNEKDIDEALSFLNKADFFAHLDSVAYRDECFKKAIVGDLASLLSNVNDVRKALKGTYISAYEWMDDPMIKDKLHKLAVAEYGAGGSDRVVSLIKNMPDDELKEWLIQAAKKDMGLGVKIIKNKEN